MGFCNIHYRCCVLYDVVSAAYFLACGNGTCTYIKHIFIKTAAGRDLMTTNINDALLLSAVMAAAIFFCRALPFFLFRDKSGSGNINTSKRKTAFFSFAEKTVPPVAMTVLAFNALSVPARTNPGEIIPVLIAAIFTVGVHLWKRNPLISIFGGTAVFIALSAIL